MNNRWLAAGAAAVMLSSAVESVIAEAAYEKPSDILITAGSAELGKDDMNGDTVLEILQYCARHYKEEISVASIAEELKLSRSSVSHIFSLRIGMNFCDYLNGLRLSDAISLLKNKSYSITEVAERSGFSTIRTFNRAFLKQYGVSPSSYRKKLLEN